MFAQTWSALVNLLRRHLIGIQSTASLEQFSLHSGPRCSWVAQLRKLSSSQDKIQRHNFHGELQLQAQQAWLAFKSGNVFKSKRHVKAITYDY